METITADLETENSGFGNYDLETKTRDLETIIYSGFGNYDLETMRYDLETGNSGFGNYDLETKACDSETITTDLETMISKL